MTVETDIGLLQFEVERGSKLFKATTTMPDNTSLAYDGNPNDVVSGATDGQTLLFNAPLGTGFIQSTGQNWQKNSKTAGGTWILLASGTEHIWYDDVLDRIVADRPIQTTLSSFYLGGQHKISSGGENVFFTNLRSEVNWFPVWQGLKDQRDLINQGPEGVYKATTRTYSEDMVSLSFIGEHPDLLPFTGDIQGSFTSNLSLFGIEFRSMLEIEEGDKVKISAYMDGGEEITYQQIITPEEAQPSGNLFELMFEHPFEFHAGTWVSTKVFIVKETPSGTLEIPMVFTTDLNGFAYAAFRFRSFSDKLVTTEEDLVPINLEIGKRYKLLKSTTVLTNNVLLGFDLNPNTATEGNTDGEDLIYHASLGTGFIQQDGTSWQKIEDVHGGSWTNNGVVIDGDGNPTAPPVVVEAVARSAGASEYVLAEEGYARTLHTDPDLLVLTDFDGAALTWHRWSNETGDADWVYADEAENNSLHLMDRSVLTNSAGELIEWHYDPTFITQPVLNATRSWQGNHKEIIVNTFRVSEPCDMTFEAFGYGETILVTEEHAYNTDDDVSLGDGVTAFISSYKHITLVSGTIRPDNPRYEPSAWHRVKVTLTSIQTGATAIWEGGVNFTEYDVPAIESEIDEDGLFTCVANNAEQDLFLRSTYNYNDDYSVKWSVALPMELRLEDKEDRAGFPPQEHGGVAQWDPWNTQEYYDHPDSIKKVRIHFRKPDDWIEPFASADRILSISISNGYWYNDPRHQASKHYFTQISTQMSSSHEGWTVEFNRVKGKWMGSITPLDTGIV